ncbi:hypothetical protein CTAYLR_007029 [Chrysophaeum taylorii]|uniref:Uncharacterized protein n=1 Tax=Chrysophaeum taylorii TaxID=2483200 RepID=A0AAD7XI88_9STRA|nr:hypothetical protein CTAYLR_007029 [Chrysophaeum taylorii]
MGVRKLAALAKKRGDARLEVLEPGTTVLIDGSGLSNFAVRGDRFELGGNYARLERIVRQYVERLRDRGYRVVVFEDGETRRLKEATRRARLATRTEEWGALRSWLTRDVSRRGPTASSTDFPLPVLFQESVRFALTRLGVEIITCEDEADQALARESARGGGVVLAEDSDFLLFERGARYVPLVELEALCEGRPVRVWTAYRLRHLLGTSHVVDFAVLLGNDYTSHLEVSDFSNVDGLNEATRRDPEKLLAWVAAQPLDWRVESADPGVAFSRALYALEPLDAFPRDPNLDVRALDGSPSPMPEALDDEEDTEAYEAVADAVASLAMARGLRDAGPLRRLCAAAGFREEYAGAALEMLDGDDDILDVEQAERWEDAVAAFRYQRALEPGLLSGVVNVADLYCGPTFHALVQRRRRGVDAAPPAEEEEDDDDDGGGGGGGGVELKKKKKEESESGGAACVVLPIDEHKDHILEHVSKNRVTIVVGETGCGKSSRIPLFLLETTRDARMFVSQPRRIAARSLCDRVRSTLPPEQRQRCGLRLGHGERDEFWGETRVWFCTTGYLVRLLASYPQAFDDHTHLVIDEVHERSVDTELLCLLARRLVASHPKIRVVLMSATLCASLYRDYFGVAEPHIFVGARRFQNKEWYADDLVAGLGGMARGVGHAASKLVEASTKPGDAVSSQVARLQLDLAVAIVDRVGTAASSILVFVAGMNDIVELTDRISRLDDGVSKRRRSFETLPIHSAVPFDEQTRVFDRSSSPPSSSSSSEEKNVVRVVLATNAAESSVTIPDCDHVVCLGVAKQLEYDPGTHRQILQTSWIARSSAIQRAGRTGRVRPGNVYRLYARRRFERMMREHAASDIHKTPLDAVVLNFYTMMKGKDESIAQLLGETLEPPDPKNISRAFESLHASRFLTKPDDTGAMTTMGGFVAALGLDLQLGRLVGLGAQLDCFDEAVDLAAILSQPQTPFRIANPLVHDLDDYVDIASRAFSSRVFWDAGVKSEPIAILRLLYAYEAVHPKTPDARRRFCAKHTLVASRLAQLASSARHLRDRALAALRDGASRRGRRHRNEEEEDDDDATKPAVSFYASSSRRRRRRRRRGGGGGESFDDLDDDDDDVASNPVRLNRLRLLLTWTARENLFCLQATKAAVATVPERELRIAVSGAPIETAHLEALRLPGPWSLSGGARKTYSANLGRDFLSRLDDASLDARLADLAFGPDAPGPLLAAWLAVQSQSGGTRCLFLVSDRAAARQDVRDLVRLLQTRNAARLAPSKRIVGVADVETPSISKANLKELKQLHDRVSLLGVSLNKDGLVACVCSSADLNPQFHIARLLGFRPFDPSFPIFHLQVQTVKQTLAFPSFFLVQKKEEEEEEEDHDEDWLDMPPAARHLAALVGGYRDSKLRVWADSRKETTLEIKVDLPTPTYRCAFGDRAHRQIFMGEHTLAKTDVNLRNARKKPQVPQFGVAAAMLDVGSDRARATGATFFPPGHLWLAKALASFGIKDMDDDLDDDDLQLVEEIERTAEAAGETLAYDPEMTRLLDKLFFGGGVAPNAVAAAAANQIDLDTEFAAILDPPPPPIPPRDVFSRDEDARWPRGQRPSNDYRDSFFLTRGRRGTASQEQQPTDRDEPPPPNDETSVSKKKKKKKKKKKQQQQQNKKPPQSSRRAKNTTATNGATVVVRNTPDTHLNR